MKCKVSTHGVTELGKVLKSLIKEGAEGAIREAINETNVAILAQSQRNIKANNSQTTGKLFNSGRVIDAKATGRGNKFRVRGSVAYDARYAYWVEFGRRAGKMPPIDNILQWVKKKGILDTYSIKTRKRVKRAKKTLQRQRSVAFAIAKSIGRKGTKAQPFLKPALIVEREKLQDRLAYHIEKYLKNAAK